MNQKTNISVVFITSRYPSINNPYNHMFVHMRCVELIKQGYSVKVYVPSRINLSYIYDGVCIEQAPAKEIAKKINKDDKIFIHLLHINPINYLNGWYIYKKILQEQISTVLYIHGNEAQKYQSRAFDTNSESFVLGLLKKIKKNYYALPKLKQFIIESNIINNYCKLAFPSLWMKRELESNLNLILKSNFSIIPNGIDINFFKYNANSYSKRKKIILIRPLSSKKYAVDIAIKLMSYLPNDFVLDIYGKGKYQAEYEKMILDLNLSKRVKIMNKFIDRCDLNRVLSEYGIFLSTTRMDAQGVMMCEAMASGLLVISSDNTAIPEFITHGVTGLLIDNENINENILDIEQVLSDQSLFSKISLSARQSMELIGLSITISNEINLLLKN